ncbi:ABC transporter permease [candidate division KSB3 bacterium]|uniref:ABC transporter permease n=1 Tax=candidate division KSB3 bacterium TaxID=2044937 RepID=A0A2G6E7J0_9BACT|nr:MAG: ABC transporter permease [candidate division KSB3 bacterium]PIE30145.1 MAG: ABC transporter permease [candidate division KSB3 bacterium]
MRIFTRFLCKKLLRLAALLATVSILSFLLVSLSPIDPISAYIGAEMLQISPEQRAIIAARWGLDKPIAQRLAHWGRQILQGNFGRSMIYNEAVLTVIGKRFLTSLQLMAAAWLLSGIAGFLLGLFSGLYEGSLFDSFVRLYSYTLASTPAFWIGMVLLVLFSVSLQWTPVCCASPLGVLPEDVTLLQKLHHILLPALTLSIVGIANIALHTREKTIDIMHSDYVLFARAQGESTLGIAWHQALRNVALPAITLQFASLSELFSGSVLAEQVFSYPGLGKATVEAGIRGDVSLLLGIVMFSTIFVFSGNTIADLCYLSIDPRMRTEGQVEHAG